MRLRAELECLYEAMEDGVCQGAASALAAVLFRFPGLVDVYEVAGGFPTSVDPNDLAFLMPCLEDVANVLLAIMPLDDILYGPSPDH
jgi:hypothetical protein